MGRTCALVSVLVSITVKYGRIKSLQANLHQAEPTNSQRQDDFLNLERERDQAKYREGSVRTTHTSKSHS